MKYVVVNDCGAMLADRWKEPYGAAWTRSMEHAQQFATLREAQKACSFNERPKKID